MPGSEELLFIGSFLNLVDKNVLLKQKIMRRDKLRFLRNIGIAAHIDAGKTTLTERILYFTGKTHHLGETHNGDSKMDTTKQEIEKGITISSAATHTQWQYQSDLYLMNIIDTPGHVDFMIEVERSLRVLDGMVALFDAVAGVEPQTETVWRQAARYKVPTIAMVNKMDRMGADFFEVINQMQSRLGAEAVAIQIPIGSEEHFEGVIDLLELKAIYWDTDGKILERSDIPEALKDEVKKYRNHLLESLANLDDKILELYIENPASIQVEQLKAALRTAVLNRHIFPVLPGAAYKNKGVQTLLNAICDYLPSPLDRGVVEGFELDSDLSTSRKPVVEAPFSALAFKIALNEQNRQLCFFRVYSGTLKIGDTILNPRTGKKERIGRLYQMHANKREEIQEVYAGDIAATMGIKAIKTGDTLCALDAPVVLEQLLIPAPVISMSIEAKSSDQLAKLDMALAKLQLEDPSFKVKVDPRTEQSLMYGMGELHLEIIVDKLKEDFGIEINVGPPSVAYLETFTQTTRHRHRLKKQRGGKGLYAEIEVMIGPADAEYLSSDAFVKEGKRLQFINSIVGGKIPKELIPAVASGFTKELENGTLAGYPIESLKVELLDGDTHSNDSPPIAFEICAIETFRAVARKLKPQLLEPIVAVTVNTPKEYLGNVLGGLNRRRGIITSQESLEQQISLEAEVPLVEMFGYINHLRTVSSGRANYSMQFKHYSTLPSQMAEVVMTNG